jgi:hypothetical protein
MVSCIESMFQSTEVRRLRPVEDMVRMQGGSKM